MKFIFKYIFSLFFICFLVSFFEETTYSWGFFAHKKINRMAVFTLPPEMMTKAEHVRDTMYKMMDLGAKGDF